MENFSGLKNYLYDENSITSEIARSLGKIAEVYWEMLPLEKRKRVVLKSYPNFLTLEYLPKTTLELMGYGKKDYSLRKKVEINLRKEAEEILKNLHEKRFYSRFKTYVERNLLPLEEVLIRIGYGERIYQILKSGLEDLFVRKEIKKEKNFREIVKFVPLVFLFLMFFVSTSTTGLFYLTYPQASPLIFLISLLIFLIFFLFF